MLDIVKGLIVVRLAVYLVTFIAVLAVLGIWMITHATITAGVAIIAGDAIATAAIASRLIKRSH